MEASPFSASFHPSEDIKREIEYGQREPRKCSSTSSRYDGNKHRARTETDVIEPSIPAYESVNKTRTRGCCPLDEPRGTGVSNYNSERIITDVARALLIARTVASVEFTRRSASGNGRKEKLGKRALHAGTPRGSEELLAYRLPGDWLLV